jgi:hypothetical protein
LIIFVASDAGSVAEPPVTESKTGWPQITEAKITEKDGRDATSFDHDKLLFPVCSMLPEGTKKNTKKGLASVSQLGRMRPGDT